ncbi:MAG: TlpA family protein disulfide reductase [Cytophagia bacterium]|nr:TlpA family protein disulfide reductase [Cytophagia bacterium]NBW35645.1 TlpA family protein disulfide reductase [Cytophagia bacterium]
MKNFIACMIALLLSCIILESDAQGFKFNDPNNIFKDSLGNTITAKAAMELASKGPFSMHTVDIGNGKKEITITLDSKSSLKQQEDENENWINKWSGNPFPQFKLQNLKGEEVDNSTLLGKYTVINFWFIGCKPCIEEIPMLNKLVEKYAKDSIQFLAPALDKKESLEKMLLKREFAYEILAESESLSKSMGLNSYPTHLILDKQGKIKEIMIGGSPDIFSKLDLLINKVMTSSE